MEFWVARDKDGGLYLYTSKPELFKNKLYLCSTGIRSVPLDCNELQEVTFENSPQKVSLVLVKEDNL